MTGQDSKAKRASPITGPACLIRDAKGSLIDNIDTDMIFHNAHLHVTDVSKMGQYTFGNLKGWEHFPDIASKYKILVVGKNFGAGSSRQQAVDCFRTLGIDAIVAQSFAPIYFRNAVNSGMAIISFEETGARHLLERLEDGAELSVTLQTGEITLATERKKTIKCAPMAPVLVSIIEAGGLFEFTNIGGGNCEREQEYG